MKKFYGILSETINGLKEAGYTLGFKYSRRQFDLSAKRCNIISGGLQN